MAKTIKRKKIPANALLKWDPFAYDKMDEVRKETLDRMGIVYDNAIVFNPPVTISHDESSSYGDEAEVKKKLSTVKKIRANRKLYQ